MQCCQSNVNFIINSIYEICQNHELEIKTLNFLIKFKDFKDFKWLKKQDYTYKELSHELGQYELMSLTAGGCRQHIRDNHVWWALLLLC